MRLLCQSAYSISENSHPPLKNYFANKIDLNKFVGDTNAKELSGYIDEKGRLDHGGLTEHFIGEASSQWDQDRTGELHRV